MTTRKSAATHTTPSPPTTAATGDLAEYEVTSPDGGTYTVLLNESDAKASGAKRYTPTNKAQTPQNK